jgi:hypothetical protein
VMNDGEKMLKQQKAGDELANTCLTLYQLHLKAPQDPGARGLFEAAYKQWKQREAGEKE